MPVRRERVTKNYTSIPNRVLRDRRLNGEKKGLVVWLLSHDPHWKIIIPVVMREMGWGKNKTYNMLKQLSEFGYIDRVQERDPVSGAFGQVTYTIFSNPDDNSAYAAAIIEQPLPDSPLPEKSKASKERNKESQETPPTPSLNSEQAVGGLNENPIQRDAKEPVPAFEQFWHAYLPDAYMSRSKTERQWRRMIPADCQKALNAVAAYLADCRANNRKRVSAPRYLRDRIWQGFSAAENITTRMTIRPGSPEWDAWRKHLVATQPSRVVAFFDHQGREGNAYTVPSRWPPDAG
ncbi:MAG: hypothetical protein ACXWKP_19690 [Bradyrhizobium sp.]